VETTKGALPTKDLPLPGSHARLPSSREPNDRGAINSSTETVQIEGVIAMAAATNLTMAQKLSAFRDEEEGTINSLLDSSSQF
jgi:hypothetical protein